LQRRQLFAIELWLKYDKHSLLSPLSLPTLKMCKILALKGKADTPFRRQLDLSIVIDLRIAMQCLRIDLFALPSIELQNSSN